MTSNYKELIFKTSFVNGQWSDKQGSKFSVLNPANRNQIAELTDGGTEIVEQAIKAAHQVFPAWSKKTAKERSQILKKWFELIHEHKEELATIMTLESGKPLQESRGEINYGAAFVEWFSEQAKRIDGDIIPAPSADKRIAVIKQAVGVVGAITPWNFPVAMITRKVAPALAAGCPVVIRPTEETPLSALALAELAHKAGFPAGVFNVVVGKDPSSMGKVLCTSPHVQKVSFTGSTRVGRLLMSQSSQTLKKLSLELGGNAPFIVFEDADIDLAVQGAVASKFRNSGQTCICVNRFLVHEKVHDEFTQKFTQAVKELKLGEGLEDSTDVGPLIHDNALEKVQDFVKDATEKGAKILTGGKIVNDYYFEPTVLTQANSDMKLAQEEVFGPVAPIFKFTSDEEAISMANDTIYGLASYFYSQNVNRCWKISEALDYGMVGINEGLISTEVAPFGGVKASGMGREGSKYGIEDYVNIKYMCFGGVQ